MKKKVKRTKHQLALLVICALCAGILPVGNRTASKAASSAPAENASTLAQESARTGYGLNNPTTDSNGVVTWDCVWFGNYWQEDTNGDGKADKEDAKQPIKWRVLSVNGDDAFLLADKNLDAQWYNDKYTSGTWETCTMRSWLNGYGAASNKEGKDYGSNNFLNNAFSAGEQLAVCTTNVVNNDNPYYNTEGGNDTSDKVYLLSIDEVMNPSYGFTSEIDSTKTRQAVNTSYVAGGGEINLSYINGAGSNDSWWLRSPGDYSGFAAVVNDDGYVNWRGGAFVNHGHVAARPALHLNLSSTSSWSYAGTVTSEGGEINYGILTSSECRMIPAFSTYKNKLDSFYRYHSFFQKSLQADRALRGTSFAIPGLSTTNLVEDDGTGTHYLNNDTYVPQGICKMDDYILISAYQESYKGLKKTKEGWEQDWRAEHNSVIYVLDGKNFQYLATLVLPNTFHNGGIAFDGNNVWLTDSKGKEKDGKKIYYVYYIKKEVIESKTAEIGTNGPYSAMIRKEEIGEFQSIQNKPSCLTWYDGKLWVGTNGETGKICGYTVTGRDTDTPVLASHKCETISSSFIPGMKTAWAKWINGIEFDGGDLYLSVSSGRQGAVKHIIRAKKTGDGYAAGSYRVAKEVLIPDMSEELMIEGNTLYCVFESGANHYNGSYGKGPNIVTERVLAFDKKLWEE